MLDDLVDLNFVQKSIIRFVSISALWPRNSPGSGIVRVIPFCSSSSLWVLTIFNEGVATHLYA